MKLYVRCDRCGRLGLALSGGKDFPVSPQEWRTIVFGPMLPDGSLEIDRKEMVCGSCAAVVSAAIDIALKTGAIPA